MRYRFLDCTLDTDRRELTRAGQVVRLRPRVYALLVFLIEHRERAVSKDEIFSAIWAKRVVSDATLSSCVKELRRLVGNVVQTLHGHGFRFTAALEPEAVATPNVAHAEAIEPSREYKQVSVLVASVPDAQEHARRLGAEAMDESMRALLERAHTIVERYGGIVSEWSGDGFVALFGAPVALEDHVRRAVQAALELVCAPDPPLRAGLDTGAVLISRLASDSRLVYTATGETRARAQRLCASAPAGVLLASVPSYRLVEEEAQAETMAGAFRVRSISVGRGGVPTRPARRRGQFVGRAREIELLRDRLSEARRGRGHAVCIVGEAGLGKSRLVEEFQQQALDTERSVAAYCLAHHATTPYRTIAMLLRGLCGCSPQDSPTVVSEKVRQALHAVRVSDPDARELLLALLEVPGSDRFVANLAPETRRSRTFRHMTGLVLRQAAERPTALIVEDLHWIDATSESWLAELIARAERSHLLLVLTCRPGYQPPWATSHAVTQFALAPLDSDDSAALLSSMPGSAPLAGETAQRIVAAAHGNPFFIEELAWAWLDAEADAETRSLPGTVQAVIAARIDQLGAREKQLLQIASVLGTRFDARWLAAVSALEPEALEAGLTVLDTRGFLCETAGAAAREYVFRHALTQEVTFRSLPAGVRARFQQRIAETLEQDFPSFAAAQPEVLAAHWEGAGRLDRAFAYWQRAAHRAIERSAHLEAIAHLNNALQANAALPRTPESERERLEVRLMLGPPLMAVRGFGAPGVEANYLEARELCGRVATDTERFVATWGFFLHHLHGGRITVARDLVTEIFALAARIDRPEYWLQAHHAGWTFESTHGDLKACLGHAQHGMRLYDPVHHVRHAHIYGMHDPGLCAHGTAAEAAWFLGQPDTALERTAQTLELARQITHPYSVLLAIVDLAWMHCVRREPAECGTHAEEALQACAAENVPNYLAVAGILHGWANAMQSKLDAGIEEMQASLASYRSLGLTRHFAFFATLLADCLQRRGQPEAGLEVLEQAHALSSRTCELRWSAEVSRLRGVCLTGLAADPHAAESAFQDGLTISRQQSARMLELRNATSLARLWSAGSQHARARSLLEPLVESFTEGQQTADLNDARAALSACAE